MAVWWRGCVLVLAATGCHHTSNVVAPRPVATTAVPGPLELPLTKPEPIVLNGRELPAPAPRTAGGPDGKTFRKLTEADCQALAAANAGAANLLDDENRVPPADQTCDAKGDDVRRVVRYYAALELRNRAAAESLERFFQLTDAEARGDLLRQAFPQVDDLLAKARKAKAADVRFPLDVGELERQRSQLAAQLEQVEHTSRLLSLDLKRRLGLPALPADERLWPSGDFTTAPTPADAEAAAAVALADRPELRGLRAMYRGLTPDTLPDVRDYLRAGTPLVGQTRPPLPVRRAVRVLNRKPQPDPAVLAELDVRRKQLFDVIAERERQVADEARAAVLGLNSHAVRAALARERLSGWDAKVAEAVKKREANQPGAEFLEPQVRTDWLKAKAELTAELAAWHQARVRLEAAQGRLVWETLSGKQPVPAGLTPPAPCASPR